MLIIEIPIETIIKLIQKIYEGQVTPDFGFSALKVSYPFNNGFSWKNTYSIWEIYETYIVD